MFLNVQSIQASKVDNPCFFQTPFFSYQMCTIPSKNWRGFEHWWLKGQMDLNWWILKKIHLSTFGSKMLLTLKIMGFENVALTKLVHIYVIEGMSAEYTWI